MTLKGITSQKAQIFNTKSKPFGIPPSFSLIFVEACEWPCYDAPMVPLLLFFFLSSAIVFPQSPAKDDPFGPVGFLVGVWQGTGSGESGNSTVEREYQFVLGGNFLQVKNVSRWAPRENTPKGEVHEDLGLISYDKARKKLVYRQFHIEGFVNQYVMVPIRDSNTLVFVYEAIENIVPGWRARETYHILGRDEFEEVFELAPPGKEFELYSRSHLRRKR